MLTLSPFRQQQRDPSRLRLVGQMAVHAVEKPVFSPSKEGQGGVIGSESDDLRLLGCKGIVIIDYLQNSQTKNEWRIFRQLAEVQ